jgi:hypothetical protein
MQKRDGLMELQVIGVVISASLLTLLIGYNWGKNTGFNNGYEAAKDDYELLGEFVEKGDREIFYK